MWSKPSIPAKFKEQGVSAKQWTDWHWQLSNTIQTAEDLAKFSDVSTKKFQEIKKIITTKYLNGFDSMRLTPYLISLIDFKNPKDPIALQHLPDIAESEADNLNYKTVWERDVDFLDKSNRMIQQKYPDVVLLRITNTCQSFCRFCFEKERTLRKSIKTIVDQKNFQNAIKIINSKKKVRQVLLSGGDPSILPDSILKEKLEAFIQIQHLKTIRINTRTLLHNPYRITTKFAKMLGQIQKKSWTNSSLDHGMKKGKQIQVGLHFNHPQELSQEAITAIRRLQMEGIQLYNQTVLLKGINDNSSTMKELFRKLCNEGVRLHYLSIAMAVPRTTHLRTSIEKAQQIMQDLVNSKEFRGQLPHLELGHHKGKQMMNLLKPENIIKKNSSIKFKSQITGKWENFPNCP